MTDLIDGKFVTVDRRIFCDSVSQGDFAFVSLADHDESNDLNGAMSRRDCGLTIPV